MRTLDDINTEILELIRLVPDASDQTEQMGTLADIEVAYNETIGSGVALPTGDKMVVVFNVSCPAGWARVSAWDDTFLRGASSYGGTGGSSGTHTHSYSGVIAHSHGAGTLATASAGTHTHSYNQLSGAGAGEVGGGTNSVLINTQNNDTGSGGSHTHSIGGNTTSTGDASATSGTATMLPPYVEVVFCSRN